MKKNQLFVLLILTGAMLFANGGGEDTVADSQLDTIGFSPSGMPIVQGDVTLSMATVQNPNAPELENLKFWKRMESITGVKTDIRLITGEALEETKTLMFASGDYPDVFIKMNISTLQEMNYGEQQGLIINLEPLLDDYAPNFTEKLESVPDLKKIVTSPLGNIYTLPYMGEGGSNNHYFLNGKWMETLGLSAPKSLDDFYNILNAFKTQDPNGNSLADEIPMTSLDINRLRQFVNFFGVPVHVPTGMTTINGSVEYVYTMNEYKEFLAFMAKLWEEDLLDHEMFTHNIQQLQAKGQGEYQRLGSFSVPGSFIFIGMEDHFHYDSIIPWKAENGNQVWADMGDIIARGTYAVTDRCEFPEVAVRWADYLYSEEGAVLSWMGVEGEDFAYEANGEWNWIVPEGLNTNQHRARVGLQGSAILPYMRPEAWLKRADPTGKRTDAMRFAVRPYDKLPLPPLFIEAANQKTINAIDADISPYADEYLAKVVTGELDLESSWDTYLDTLEAMRLSSMVEFYNEAYQKYMNN